MKYLLLLNRKFPYKSGEAFIENEIEEIAPEFDRILIFPSDITPNDRQTRTIKAPNVKVNIFESDSLQKRKIKYTIGGLKYLFSNMAATGFRNRAIECYFLSAAGIQVQKIKRILDTYEFSNEDTIFIYSYWLYTTAEVACQLKLYFNGCGLKSVAFSRAHRFDIYEEKRHSGFLPRRVELLSALDSIYACSDNGKIYLQNHYPEYKNKIHTSRLGTYNHGEGFSRRDTQLHIVSCSRVVPVKRVDLIIDSLKLLKDSGIKIQWTHLGGGELLDKIKTKSVNEIPFVEVHLKGTISNTEVYAYYSNNPADIFINVSSSEGLPVSIMEAISYGIPTIATDVGGTSEIVVDGVSGYLLREQFEPEELATCIKRVADLSETEYSELRKSTRKLWLEKFQAKKNYLEFSQLICRLKE